MRFVDRRPAAVSCLALVLIVAGCSGGGGGASKAETVLRERLSNPDAAGYAFQIAEGTPSPAVRGILIEALSSADFETARAASHALVGSDDPAVIEAMRQAYAARRGAVKMNAALVLARAGDDDARAWLLEEASRGGRLNPEVFALLAEQGEQEALVAVLRPFLASDDLATRNEAYAVLGEIGQPWAVAMLREGLEAERGESRVQPIQSLGRTGDPAAAAAIKQFVNTQGLVFASLEALGALGDPATAPAVMTMLGHEEALVRVYAATAAWRLGNGDDAAPVVAALATDEDPVVRRNLAEQLEPIDDPRVTATLIGLLADEDVDVRIAAIRALDTRGGPAVDDALVGLTDDPDYRVASAALVALSAIGGPGVVDSITPLLDSQNPYVAVAAATAVLAIDARVGSAGG